MENDSKICKAIVPRTFFFLCCLHCDLCYKWEVKILNLPIPCLIWDSLLQQFNKTENEAQGENEENEHADRELLTLVLQLSASCSWTILTDKGKIKGKNI